MIKTAICRLVLLVLPVLGLVGGVAKGDVIVEHTSGGNVSLPDSYIGQSFTLPIGPSFDNIRFSWLSMDATTEIASGNLFLLDQEYSGTPAALSSLTTGFIAESTNVASGAYVFSSLVTLDGGSMYFAYMGTGAQVVGAGAAQAPGGYAGGEYYQPEFADNPTVNYGAFSATDRDALFRVQGTAVPEPFSSTLSFIGVAALTFCRWRRTHQERVFSIG